MKGKVLKLKDGEASHTLGGGMKGVPKEREVEWRGDRFVSGRGECVRVKR